MKLDVINKKGEVVNLQNVIGLLMPKGAKAGSKIGLDAQINKTTFKSIK